MLGAGGVEVDVSVREGRGQRSCWVGLVGGGGVGGLKREREGGGGNCIGRSRRRRRMCGQQEKEGWGLTCFSFGRGRR